MSERIKNFKIFKNTLILVFVIGVIFTLYNLLNNHDNYQKNKDGYDYSVDISYDKVNIERLLAGEEIYLDKDEYSLFEKTIPLKFIKKVNRLAFLDKGIKETTTFYEAKYSEKVTVSHESSKYKIAKAELINNYLNEKLSDKKYLTTSNVYLLSSNGDFDYIKEVVYFVNTTDFTVKAILEINSKYSHKEDLLEYSSCTELDNNFITKTNELVKEAQSVYNEIDSNKDSIYNKILKENNLKTEKIYIYDKKNIIAYLENKSTIKLNIENL